ncbi:hypothetical protein BDV95DRAFT_272942 [Massariosphaeria phaeospora]|uniref:Hyaluronan/mRNA-binding protein domain-containing protein n=1 Tax=Massariosphaeria phaeospora TaxID=100035 RepID=A0A7C8IBD5_9PLEO|nr:hypothetical protein BDV95DRAFT_272942 [Massariosphaeria phaeospora]
MAGIASKNLYELLGNDADQDPELRQPDLPTKAIDKTAPRAGKRNGPVEPPSRSSGTSSARGGGAQDSGNANDNHLRDRGVGSDKNRSRGSGDASESNYDRPRGGQRGRARGNRFGNRGNGAGAGASGDRHSRSGIAEHEKQAAHGWGGPDGNAELADEQAGEAIAKADEKEAVVEAVQDEAAEPEPEDKTKSYAAYIAEQAERKSLAASNVRKANEGSSKKFPEGTAIPREEEEDAYIAGSGGKAKRERARKEKNVVELDGDRMLQQAPRDDNFRGRGRGRGRGSDRGSEGRGRGGGRGRGEGRGRGGGGGGDRGGERRGGGGGSSSTPNISDSSAFPSLGS